MTNTLFFIWQLPQNIIGIVYYIIHHNKIDTMIKYNGFNVYLVKNIRYGISLGQFIFIPKGYEQTLLLKHEIGHQIQSTKLGFLYLLVIGIPSFIWNTFFKRYRRLYGVSYYSFYTERWADKLVGIERDE